MSISLEQLNTSIDKEHKELLKKYKKLEEGIEEQSISKYSKETKKETLKLHLKNDIELLRGKSYKSLLDTIDYHYVLHIGVQPKSFMNLDEVKEEIRTLEFQLNKFYLKSTWRR